MSILDAFHDRRESADEDVVEFLSGAKNYNIIFFDTETNGFVGNPMPSLLSISALRGQLVGNRHFELTDAYNRFYLPIEPYNEKAIAVNGLTQVKVGLLREEYAPYSLHFIDDYVSFIQFCEGVDLFVGHNLLDFDTKFLPFIDWKTKKVFDTMKSNRDIVCAEWQDYRNQWKNPKLSECIKFYNIKEEGELHTSSYDTLCTKQVFMEMLSRSSVRLRKF